LALPLEPAPVTLLERMFTLPEPVDTPTPEDMLTSPPAPLEELLDPAEMVTSPPSPEPERPTTTDRLPAVPAGAAPLELEEEPVVSVAAPLGPAPEASADLRLSRPEPVEAPEPVLMDTLPPRPVVEVVAPAVTTTAPPAPESEEPTCTVTPPATPLVAVPDCRSREPVVPL